VVGRAAVDGGDQAGNILFIGRPGTGDE